MRGRVEVLEDTILTETDVRLAVVADDLDVFGGRADKFHPVPELDRAHHDAGRIALESGHLDSVIAARPAVATMRKHRLRGTQDDGRQHGCAEQLSLHSKRYRLSGTFSGQRATTTTMKTPSSSTPLSLPRRPRRSSCSPVASPRRTSILTRSQYRPAPRPRLRSMSSTVATVHRPPA